MMYSKNNFHPSPYCFHNIKLVQKTIKILGVYFDSNLNWSPHITYCIKKASKHLHLLRILKPMVSKKELITLHKALIQSSLEYGSQVYLGSIKASDRIRINKTTARSHKIICRADCNSKCLNDPDSRRLEQSSKLFNSALFNTNHVLHSRTPNFLPSRRRLNITASLTTRRLNSFV